MSKLLRKKKIKNLLIIGGTGFIGTHLIRQISKSNFNIYCLSTRHLKSDKKLKYIKYILCDISNRTKLFKTLSRYSFDIVVNLGGHVNHTEWKKTYNTHYLGCKNLADYFLNKKISKFIQLSSSLEYGSNSSPHLEKMKINIKKLKTAYSIGKAKATRYLLKLNKKKNFPVTILRLYLAYGPGQDYNRIIPITIKNFINQRKISLTNCNQIRDFLYIDDLINLILKIISYKKNKNVIFNVGSGKPIKLKLIIELIKHKLKKGTPLYGKIPLRKDENINLYPNIALVKKTFKWKPLIDLDKGITSTINYYKNAKR